MKTQGPTRNKPVDRDRLMTELDKLTPAMKTAAREHGPAGKHQKPVPAATLAAMEKRGLVVRRIRTGRTNKLPAGVPADLWRWTAQGRATVIALHDEDEG